MLARRHYARAELERRLALRGGSREEIQSTLTDLERLGYLSDGRYAQSVVAQKAGRYSRRAIARELAQRQVAEPAVKEALAAIAGNDEIAEATALWQRRFGVAPSDDREKARQLRFLFSRGYSTDVAWKVLRAAGVKDDQP